VTTYKGTPPGRVQVHPEEGEPYDLPLRLDLISKSPSGFAWGYGGSGPAQLALALCAHVLEDDFRALEIYQDVKSWLILPLGEHEPFELTADDVRAAVDAVESAAAEQRAMAR